MSAPTVAELELALGAARKAADRLAAQEREARGTWYAAVIAADKADAEYREARRVWLQTAEGQDNG